MSQQRSDAQLKRDVRRLAANARQGNGHRPGPSCPICLLADLADEMVRRYELAERSAKTLDHHP